MKAFVKAIHPNVAIDGKSVSRVHFQAAPENAPFPYLVYDFPNISPDGESMDLAMVDIDGWDSPTNGDTAALETLMALVNGNGNLISPTGLDKATLFTEAIAVTFYLDIKIPLRDDDPRIRRRKYIYQAKLFRRG